MTPDEHRESRELLGPFALGQLTDTAQSELASHVGGCPDCQADMAELEPAAALLRLARAAGPVMADTAPSLDLVDRIVARTRQADEPAPPVHGRRRGLSAGVFAAAAAVAAAFVLGAQLGTPVRQSPAAVGPSTPGTPTGPPTAAVTGPPVEDLDVQTLAAGVAASAGLVSHTWGTEIKLVAAGLDDGGTYQVSIIADDGAVVAAGTFLGTGREPVRCSLNAALPRGTAAVVQVVDADGLVVLAAGA